MHTSSSDYFYNAEANQRRYYYPPPYWYNNGWYYAYPWLWYDGNKHGAYQYSQWQTKITARMAVPAPFRATMWGDYTPTDGTGTIYVCFWNDSSSSLTGRVQFVITEDSLYHVGSNSDGWHNHVARDYLPDYNGEVVSIPAGDSLILSRAFTIDAGWDESMIELVSWIQDDYMQPDTIKEIWQGALIKLSELTGIAEEPVPGKHPFMITAMPNPCTDQISFSFGSTKSIPYRIIIYDIAGRQIRALSGETTATDQSVQWDLRDRDGTRVATGSYFYRFESDTDSAEGRIVIW